MSVDVLNNDNIYPTYGTVVKQNPPPKYDNLLFTYPGISFVGRKQFGLNEEILSKHILLLGGSGCGKSNTFLYTLDYVLGSMKSNDIAVVFDTKGEFFDNNYRNGDYIIGNSKRFYPHSFSWNIFDEIRADGDDERYINMNAREMASALFHGRGSETQPFFCKAARDIFRAILLHFLRQSRIDKTGTWAKMLNNASLVREIRQYTVQDLRNVLDHYHDTKSMLQYIGDGTSNQALGVLAELNSMIEEYFVGILAEDRTNRSISMRNAVRKKGGKAIFIEYDVALGETLTPMYRILVDQALKEALSQESEGHVYLFADEFKLLPMLQHIDDALNFGRGLGVNVMAGIQNIDQLYDIYGERKGSVLASSFGSIFAFYTNDSSSREYISERFGKNMVDIEYYTKRANKPCVHHRDGYTVENWEQLDLSVGQAIIGLCSSPPFIYQFSEYKKRARQ